MPWSLEFAFSHMCHATTEDSEIRTLHPGDDLRAHAAAVSAADNADIQKLYLDAVEQAAANADEVLRLRERIKVLEDALRVAFRWGGGLTVAEGKQIRAALGDKNG